MDTEKTLPSRRLVVCTAEGQYGIVGLETRTAFESEVPLPQEKMARLVRVTNRYVLYREGPPHVAA